MRVWKWSSIRVRLEDLEVVEAPLYRSTGGRLLKTLFSTACRMDCLYCPWRVGSPVERRTWSIDRLVRVALSLYKSRLISGVFISSCLYGDPDIVSEHVIEVAERLRKLGYRGYIHLRLMPGTSLSLIREAVKLANRVGLNLEAPTHDAFGEIAPSKGSWSLDILSKLFYAASLKAASIDTQFVVGASNETDEEYLRALHMLAEGGIDVVHFSPYTQIPWTPLAQRRRNENPARANTLYQLWRLLHDYRFKPEELKPLLDEHGMLPYTSNLKLELAKKHPEWYPIDPCTAPLRELLRVPGIGPGTARKMIEERRRGTLTIPRLKELLGERWSIARKYLDLSMSRC